MKFRYKKFTPNLFFLFLEKAFYNDWAKAHDEAS